MKRFLTRLSIIILLAVLTLTALASCSNSNSSNDCEHLNVTEVIIVKATCTEPGYLEERCADCDSFIVGSSYGPEWHSFDESVTHPTCISQGFTTYTCSKCSYSYDDDFVDYGLHSFSSWIITSDSTCTSEGSKYRECSVCYETESNTIPSKGHIFSEWYEDKPAGCTEKGGSRRDCSRCGGYEIETLPALGHSYSESVTEPTCTGEGYTSYVCGCGDSYTTAFVSALGHSYEDWYTHIEATEDENGESRRNCKRCSGYESNVIPATGYNYTTIVTAPTCTERGYTTYTCVCGDTFVADYTDAKGHSFGEWYTVTEATCTEVGESLRDCSICDGYDVNSIPAKGHKYTQLYVPASCTEQGYTINTCACGDSYATGYTSATGHSYAAWYTVSTATCTEDGEMRRDCKNCDHVQSSTIGAKGHSYSAVTTAPTCTEQGYTTYSCQCGYSYTTEYKSANGHIVGEWEVHTAATQTDYGEKRRNCTADDCDYYVSARIEKIGSSNLYYETDGLGYIVFGSYPQTRVVDDTVISSLNTMAGALPTTEDSNSWTSYGYYVNGEVKDYMWYIDLNYGTERYRGVYFNTYRPYWASGGSSSYQSYNGYNIGTVYWFRFDPIRWSILEQNDEEGTALLICDLIIDSQSFDPQYNKNLTVNGEMIYASNYEYSAIRAWLLDNFMNTAFTELQQKLLCKYTVDNSISSTNCSNEKYICSNTVDKVFLISYEDAINGKYGFSTSRTSSETRVKLSTDYAKCQGFIENVNNGGWWLRSPCNVSNMGNEISSVTSSGWISYQFNDDTSTGVVPAIKLRLHCSESEGHSYTADVKDPTCINGGYTQYRCECGNYYVGDYTAPYGHILGEWYTVTQETCTFAGERRADCKYCSHYETESVEATGHSYLDWYAVTEATCTTSGKERRDCENCSHYESKTIPSLGHSFLQWYTVTSASCTTTGEIRRDCENCSHHESKTVDAFGHTLSEWSVYIEPTLSSRGEDRRYCTANRCGYYEHRLISSLGYTWVDDDTIEFGSYPQTEVKDADLIANLNTMAGELPNTVNNHSWTSYRYYDRFGIISTYMWYVDINYGTERYRGVYFWQYRGNKAKCDYESTIPTYQDDNGYIYRTVYWFKFDPITWTVLEECDGKALLLCDMIIDSRDYNGDPVAYPGIYEYSNIRRWLINDFLNTAFSELQREIINARDVGCSDGADKVFLISEEEAMNTNYGFSADTGNNSVREKTATDYAKCQGVYVLPSGAGAGNSRWWLRCPYNNYGTTAPIIDYLGSVRTGYSSAESTSTGVVPALEIILQ